MRRHRSARGSSDLLPRPMVLLHAILHTIYSALCFAMLNYL